MDIEITIKTHAVIENGLAGIGWGIEYLIIKNLNKICRIKEGKIIFELQM